MLIVTCVRQEIDDIMRHISIKTLFLLCLLPLSLVVALPSGAQDLPPLAPSAELSQRSKAILPLSSPAPRPIPRFNPRPSPILAIPDQVKVKGLKLTPFPKINEGDAIEDILLILKERLDYLHDILYPKP